MKQIKILWILFLFLFLEAHMQTGHVGINTTTSIAMLHEINSILVLRVGQEVFQQQQILRL